MSLRCAKRDTLNNNNTSRAMTSTHCTISPKFAVFDEKLQIEITGLIPSAPVTIDCSIIYYKVLWIGFGHFYADENGRIDPGKLPSHGGTWTGVKPMGLFTSMRFLPSPVAAPRLIVIGDSRKVLKFTVHAWKGHLTQDDLHELHANHSLFQTHRTLPDCGNVFHERFVCEATVERTYCHPSIKRIPIRVEHNGYNLRGVLFIPPGANKFPGVLDVTSGAGRCEENRAALLARHGFVVLALALFAYEDLPKIFAEAKDWRYLDAAIEWLSSQEFILPGGIGMIGTSLASAPIMNVIMGNAKVVSTICVNGGYFWPTDGNLTNLFSVDRAQEAMNAIPANGTHEFTDGVLTRRLDGKPKLSRPLLTHAHDNYILLIIGENEICMHAPEVMDDILDQWHRSGKTNIRKMVIPGEGHFIEPPYASLTLSTGGSTDDLPPEDWMSSAIPYRNAWGGRHSDHEENSVFAWNTVLDCFRKTLPADHQQAKL